MQIRMPKAERVYAVLQDNETIVLVLGGNHGDMNDGTVITVVDSPAGDMREVTDGDVLLYIGQPEFATGEARGRLMDEYENYDDYRPELPKTRPESEAAADRLVRRLAGFDAALGGE